MLSHAGFAGRVSATAAALSGSNPKAPGSAGGYLLLAALGRKPSEQAAVRGDGRKDRHISGGNRLAWGRRHWAKAALGGDEDRTRGIKGRLMGDADQAPGVQDVHSGS